MQSSVLIQSGPVGILLQFHDIKVSWIIFHYHHHHHCQQQQFLHMIPIDGMKLHKTFEKVWFCLSATPVSDRTKGHRFSIVEI